MKGNGGGGGSKGKEKDFKEGKRVQIVMGDGRRVRGRREMGKIGWWRERQE